MSKTLTNTPNKYPTISYPVSTFRTHFDPDGLWLKDTRCAIIVNRKKSAGILHIHPSLLLLITLYSKKTDHTRLARLTTTGRPLTNFPIRISTILMMTFIKFKSLFVLLVAVAAETSHISNIAEVFHFVSYLKKRSSGKPTQRKF